MYMESIEDIECNRCKGIYEYPTHKKQLAVMVGHVYLSVCPKCTDEIATLMGYTTENIMNILSGMERADTERNRQNYIDEGYVCKTCLKKFKNNEARIKHDDCTNTYAWHIECYDRDTSKTKKEKTH